MPRPFERRITGKTGGAGGGNSHPFSFCSRSRKESKKAAPQEEPAGHSREEKNLQELLTHYLSARVRVGRGKITIEYHGQEDLERLYSLIVGKEGTF